MKISASERTSLIRLSGNLPKGSDERRAILSTIKKIGGNDAEEKISIGSSSEKNPERREILERALELAKLPENAWKTGEGIVLSAMSNSDYSIEKTRVNRLSLLRDPASFNTPSGIKWDPSFAKFYEDVGERKYLTSPAKVAKIFKDNGWKLLGQYNDGHYLQKNGEVAEIKKGGRAWGESGVIFQILPWFSIFKLPIGMVRAAY